MITTLKKTTTATKTKTKLMTLIVFSNYSLLLFWLCDIIVSECTLCSKVKLTFKTATEISGSNDEALKNLDKDDLIAIIQEQ